ncbi:hypothetical protein RJ639_029710 [Escallonia herrerae]|uniref:Uncharacterized protein n=1 Tax=Escallonia herrerae TaxID=1293975 RepID=A0AA88X729_9ASTE|nr:hypothetical protein RJ639_029710 [Escallonia herrerae]
MAKSMLPAELAQDVTSAQSSLNQIESSGARAWQLQFRNKLPSTLFTGGRIESEDGEPLQIAIVDASTKKIITSGPLSSLRIEIVVLDGDFGADDQDHWSETDFRARIVRAREGKRPLVTGELVVTLREGVGYIGDISFTDNSSWIRSRKFRLGAGVQSTSTEVKVREARSEAFIVKDHRGESYRKHHPPALNDEVWRLERIAKDGAFHKRLVQHGISSVKEFLRMYVTDPSLLRNILGGGISNKTWDIIIEHAAACVLDDKLYMYRAAENFGLVFNSIFKVVGATFDGQNYQCLDKLDVLQMRLVEDLKLLAYKNVNDLVLIDEPLVVNPTMLLPGLQPDPFISPTSSPQNVNILVADQAEFQSYDNFTAIYPGSGRQFSTASFCGSESSFNAKSLPSTGTLIGPVS